MEKVIIKIAGLSDGEYDFEFDEPVSKLALDDPFYGNFNVKIKLQKMVHQIFIDVSLCVNARFECDRCAADYETVLKNSFRMVYALGSSRSGDDEDSGDFIFLPAETDKINIASEIHDFALLSIPMKKLCSEDCKGLCPKCGKNLNEGLCSCNNLPEDDRWLPLKELKNKLNNN